MKISPYLSTAALFTALLAVFIDASSQQMMIRASLFLMVVSFAGAAFYSLSERF